MSESIPSPRAEEDDAPLVAADAVEALLPGGEVADFKPNVEVLDHAGYLAWYRLAEPPFGDALQPRFYFQTDGHDEALARVREAVRHGMALALVTGPSGSGKSLLSQLLLRELDGARTEVALALVSPEMGKTALLKALMTELRLPVPEGAVAAQDLLSRVHARVLELHREGRRLVLLVDECHFLASDSLHMIRALTNLETEEAKLVTIVLFGESVFLRRLRHPSYASLQSRIGLCAELRPMDPATLEQYVKFRVMMAGRMDALFTADAFALLHAGTGGIARRVNVCCTRALMEGAARRMPRVDAALIRNVLGRG